MVLKTIWFNVFPKEWTKTVNIFQLNFEIFFHHYSLRVDVTGRIYPTNLKIDCYDQNSLLKKIYQIYQNLQISC